MVFVDGHHNGKATVGYFRQLKPYLSKNGIIVFDDVIWSSGMMQAWKEISGDSSVKDFMSFGGMGVVAL